MSTNALLALGDRPVAFHPNLCRIVGDLKAGLFLGQALYWQNRVSPDRNGWWWHSQDEWTDETTLSRRECDTVRKRLKELGLLEVVQKGYPKTTWYRVDLERLSALLVELVEGREYPDDDHADERSSGGDVPPGTEAENSPSVAQKRQTETTKSAKLRPPKAPNCSITESTTEKPQGGDAQNVQPRGGGNRPGMPPDPPGLDELAAYVAGEVARAQRRGCTDALVEQWLAQLRLMARSGLSVESLRAGWDYGRSQSAYRVAVMTPAGFNRHHDGLVAEGLANGRRSSAARVCQGVHGAGCGKPATIGASGRNTHCMSCYTMQAEVDAERAGDNGAG